MKYNVSINEKSRSITVTLADGTKGVARCCPTDRFDINTGIELALERARVAQRVAHTPIKSPSVMELVKALEKALPKGQMVVVGNGKKLTDKQKKWLHSLADGCSCKCHEIDEDEVYDRGYADGYTAGYTEAITETKGEESEAAELEEALEHIRDILADVGITI
jgi:hypothetical protein